MLKNALTLALLGVLLSCGTAPAMAKGYSSGRSYSRPAIIHQHVTVNKTTIVHEGGGSSGNGLLTGLIVGHMLAQPTQPAAPVVIEENVPHQIIAAPAPTSQVVEQVQPVQPVQQENDSHMLLYFIVLVATCGFFLVLHKQNKDKYNA